MLQAFRTDVASFPAVDGLHAFIVNARLPEDDDEEDAVLAAFEELNDSRELPLFASKGSTSTFLN